jgi:hypothetical protein
VSASLPASTEAERGGSKVLWFGVLIGPLCWSLQILIGYNLEEIACNPGSSTQKIAGAEVEPVAIALTLVLGAVTALGTLVSYRCWRRTRSSGDASTGGRSEWMALAGVITSALFLFWIMTALFAPGFLVVCDPSL